MKTLVLEAGQSVFFTAPASLEDPASGWEVPGEVSPYIRWVAGNFVESGNPNSNGQYWTAEDLARGDYTINYSPLNLLHRFKTPIGFFHGTRRVPTTPSPVLTGSLTIPSTSNQVVWTQTAANTTNSLYSTYDVSMPSITETAEKETAEFAVQFLAGVWTHVFPHEFDVVQRASKDGRLFASMECVGSQLHCTGDNGCDNTFGYFDVDSHCAHLRERTSVRHIVDPIFRGGALIVPPVRPGWKKASASVLEDDLASLIAEAETAQGVYEDWVAGGHDLSASDWESLMAQVMASSSER